VAQDAALLRARAKRCLELADLISDPVTAAELRTKAADLHAQAAELEGESRAPGSPTSIR
jgi:hypothetical protein